jgi:hypothetical protein
MKIRVDINEGEGANIFFAKKYKKVKIIAET